MNKPTGRGGPGRNQGRKPGIRTTNRTSQFTKRITPEEKLQLEAFLEKMRRS